MKTKDQVSGQHDDEENKHDEEKEKEDSVVSDGQKPQLEDQVSEQHDGKDEEEEKKHDEVKEKEAESNGQKPQVQWENTDSDDDKKSSNLESTNADADEEDSNGQPSWLERSVLQRGMVKSVHSSSIKEHRDCPELQENNLKNKINFQVKNLQMSVP